MKLTETQIQELYKFTRAHFVYHYDLQTEIVDHLAGGIENQSAKNPQLSFQEALDKEFKKFGIFGFQDVITERQKVLSKRYWKIILRFYQEFFTLPKIALTLLFMVILFSILTFFPVDEQQFVLLGAFMLFGIPSAIKMIKYHQFLKKKERKWMLEEILFNHIGGFNIIVLPIYIFNFGIGSDNPYILAFISIVAISVLLMLYVMVYIIPPKAEELLAETYPEYKLMQTL